MDKEPKTPCIDIIKLPLLQVLSTLKMELEDGLYELKRYKGEIPKRKSKIKQYELTLPLLDKITHYKGVETTWVFLKLINGLHFEESLLVYEDATAYKQQNSPPWEMSLPMSLNGVMLYKLKLLHPWLVELDQRLKQDFKIIDDLSDLRKKIE